MKEPSALTVEIARLDLKPTDVLVVHVDAFLSGEQLARLVARMGAIGLPRERLMVLERGMSVSVLSKEAST